MEANVRLITATHQNLQKLVQKNQFRSDLFFRLNVMTIIIPSLKERQEDIPTLTTYFIKRINEEYGSCIQGISPEALECLKRYHWPGNVRELRNAIERAMMLEQDSILSTRHFGKEITNTAQQTEKEENKTFFTLPPEGISIDEVEKELINQALDRFAGNQTQAAKCLHITRDTLRSRLKRHGLSKI